VTSGRPTGTALVGKYLLAAERVHIAERRHWAVLALPVSASFGGLLVALALDTALPASAALIRDIVWLAWTALLVWLAWHIVEWWADRFVVTNKRVMLVRGIITRKVGMMPLSKVTDMSYERSVIARLMGFGVFIMESAGQDQAFRRIRYVPQPDWLYREMCALLFTPDAVPTVPADGDDGTGSGIGGLAGGPRGGGFPGFGPDDPDPDAPRRPSPSPASPAAK
jgi:membrane protein YdbS with pleckstrin-like domain